MYAGDPNYNILQKLEKMVITDLDRKKEITVLYNPQSYTQSRNVNYANTTMLGANGPVVQFQSGGAESVSFDLFFDSLYAGAEVGGDLLDKGKFTVNMMLPDTANIIDIREYTKKVYSLMEVFSKVHRPPILHIKWGSLQFIGFLAGCSQRFTRFDAKGLPVRAILSCKFIESPSLNRPTGPLESPDTTKYHVIRAGDSLWSIAAQEYGDSGLWREIARANGLSNPRALRTGDMLVVPALKH